MNKRPLSSITIDWVVTILICWMYFGLFKDIWGHNHLKVSELESFFTPSHYLFYSGFGAIFLFYLFLGFQNFRKGYSFKNLLPKGYSFLDIGWFIAGGIFDFIWHTTFGVEKNLDALISPAHVFLGIGTTLMLTGPIRSRWSQSKLKFSYLNLFPLLICFAIIWTCYAVMTEYAHPIFQPILSGLAFNRQNSQIFQAQGLGVASLFIQTILMISIFYIHIFRQKFLFGSFTFLITVNTTLMTIMASKSMSPDWLFIGGALFAGILIDILYLTLKPSLFRPTQFQIFSFSTAIIYNLMYFISLFFGKGFWTSIHLTTGVIFESGIIIWLYSLIILSASQQTQKSTNS
jgi:hypothetical protein